MIRRLHLLIVFSAAVMTGFAQQLDQILDRHYQAHQQQYWDAIQSVSSQGNWHGDFGDHTANFYLKRPQKFLMVNQKDRFIQAFDGLEAWTIAKWTKSKVTDLDDQQAMIISHVYVFGSPINQKHALEYKGEVSVDNQLCHWIVDQQGSSTYEYFVSSETSLLYKTILTDSAGEFEKVLTITIKKYRKLQGLIFPTVIDLKTDDRFSEFAFGQIVVGDIIENKRFQKPEN